jgi:hypothetical protein
MNENNDRDEYIKLSEEVLKTLGFGLEASVLISLLSLSQVCPTVELIDEKVINAFIIDVMEEEEPTKGKNRTKESSKKVRVIPGVFMIFSRFDADIGMTRSQLISRIVERYEKRDELIKSEVEGTKQEKIDEKDRELFEKLEGTLLKLTKKAKEHDLIAKELKDSLIVPTKERYWIKNVGRISSEFWEEIKREISKVRSEDRRIEIVEFTPYPGEEQFKLVLMYIREDSKKVNRCVIGGIIAEVVI